MANNRAVGSGSSSTPAANLESSGRSWASRFRATNELRELRQPFRGYVEAFVGALRAAGARVTVNATYRDPKRAYLMHWCWKIARNHVNPTNVPARDGVPISWEHRDKDEKYSDALSIAAAREMVSAFQMERLGVVPQVPARIWARYRYDDQLDWNSYVTGCGWAYR